ncbi:GDSL-type esterase/lipase family protein [Kitasatospora terrestris]|uniref:SGNH hydrolase-type esterase domain-containing protein n=1 Tax=Kitasatospora terrestris TaxID=258051 RepID=A0ABP9ER59_9ACTN
MKSRVPVLAAAATLLAAAAVTAAPPTTAAAATPRPVVRVLPLGDSITYGVGSCTGAGYRLPLQGMAETGGRYHLDFVGSAQPAGHMVDPQNEGHPGKEIAEIGDGVRQGWITAARPDVVLLHIGINDLANNDRPTEAPDRAKALIDQIFAAQPGVTVIMQGLIPTSQGWGSSPANLSFLIADYNTQLLRFQATEQQQGKHFLFVEAPGLTPLGQSAPAELADALHPNDAGYRRLAQNFSTALDQAWGARWFTGTAGLPNPAAQPDTVHLVTVAPAPDRALRNTEGDYAAGSWSAWQGMDRGSITEVASAATRSTNHVFAVTTSGQLLEKDGNYATGQWSSWFQPDIGPLREGVVPAAIAASSYDDVVHLVAVGTDGHLYNSDGDWAAGHWNGWTDHGGSFTRVASAMTADRVNHIFAIESGSGLVKELDGDYCHGAWSNWQTAGKNGLAALDVAASGDGDTVHLSAIRTDGGWSTTDGDFDTRSWNDWTPMGDRNLERIASASANHVNHVFFTTTDHRLGERDGDFTTGSWSAWGAPTGAGDAIGISAAFTL